MQRAAAKKKPKELLRTFRTEANEGFAWVCVTHCGRISPDLLVGPDGWSEVCQNSAKEIALENIIVNEEGRAKRIIVP